MTEAIREQLSAFVDGELSPVEAELLLKRVERDPALRAALDRYLLLGAGIRSETTGSPSHDFAARVANALDHDQKSSIKMSSWAARLTGRASHRRKQWMAWGGGAVAAGMAALAMLVVPHSLVGVPNSTTVVTANAQDSLGVADTQTNEGVTVISADAIRASQLRQQVENNFGHETLVSQHDNRLASYVMAHSQYSSPLNRRTVLTGLLVDEASGDEPSGEVVGEQLQAKQASSSASNANSSQMATPVDRAVAIR